MPVWCSAIRRVRSLSRRCSSGPPPPGPERIVALGRTLCTWNALRTRGLDEVQRAGDDDARVHVSTSRPVPEDLKGTLWSGTRAEDGRPGPSELYEVRGGWWWATDITRLTWVECEPIEATSHAIAFDFPHCCDRNQPQDPRSELVADFLRKRGLSSAHNGTSGTGTAQISAGHPGEIDP